MKLLRSKKKGDSKFNHIFLFIRFGVEFFFKKKSAVPLFFFLYFAKKDLCRRRHNLHNNESNFMHVVHTAFWHMMQCTFSI